MTRHRYFIARPGGVIEPATLLEFARWFEASHTTPFERGGRRVAFARLEGGVEVSTVFLGMDYCVCDGPALLFETMIFSGPHDQYQNRYPTVEEARAGHAAAVRLACGEPEPEQLP